MLVLNGGEFGGQCGGQWGGGGGGGEELTNLVSHERLEPYTKIKV